MLFFSNVLSFVVAVTGLVGVAQAQAPLTSGTYRIFNGPQSARSFPPATQQGAFETEITFSEQFASVWEDWELVSNGNDEFFIQSARTGARAYAPPTIGEQVLAASNEQSSWLIQGGGQSSTQENLYTIKLSSGDFLWTLTPRVGREGMITLQGSDGSSSQRFVFQKI